MLNRRRFVAPAAALPRPPSIVAPARGASADWPANGAHRRAVHAGRLHRHHRAAAGNRLQEVWGQPVVVENKPGAGGNIAADLVAKSDPDGYTIFIVGPGMATNQFLYPSLSYDPVADFAPVTLLITQPNMMCVPNTSPAKSVQEFIAYCNANRGKVTYASSGNGTTLHLCGELFKRLAEGRDDAHPLSRRRAGDQRSHPRPRRRRSSTTARRSAACAGRRMCAGSR